MTKLFYNLSKYLQKNIGRETLGKIGNLSFNHLATYSKKQVVVDRRQILLITLYRRESELQFRVSSLSIVFIVSIVLCLDSYYIAYSFVWYICAVYHERTYSTRFCVCIVSVGRGMRKNCVFK